MIDKYTWYEKVGIYLGIFVFLSFVLSPFVEGFLVSLKPMHQLFSSPYSFWPKEGSFDAYFRIWQTVPLLWLYILNGILIAVVATFLGLCMIIPAAYALSASSFVAGAMLSAFLMVNMFSGAVLLIPLYRLMREVRPAQHLFRMIVPARPSSLDRHLVAQGLHAAHPQGARGGRLRRRRQPPLHLRRVVLPLAMPGILIAGINCFLTVYAQQFIYALTFNSKSEYMPLSVGLFAFFGRQEVTWNELMAASIVGITPVMIVFFFLQKYLVAGLTAGAVKS
jgi:carbohydrate ABC transporter membrane protein 2, CUT1 family (TC 3.A.1.1.-)